MDARRAGGAARANRNGRRGRPFVRHGRAGAHDERIQQQIELGQWKTNRSDSTNGCGPCGFTRRAATRPTHGRTEAKVLVNGSYAKPSREVKPGDAITRQKGAGHLLVPRRGTRLVAAAGQGGPPLCRERHAARRARQAEHPEAEHFRPARPGQRKAHEARAPRDRLADGRALFRRRGRAVLNLYGTESHADTIRFRPQL